MTGLSVHRGLYTHMIGYLTDLHRKEAAMTGLTPEQQALDAKLWWTTVRPWLATMTSWPDQHATREHMQRWAAGEDTHPGEDETE